MEVLAIYGLAISVVGLVILFVVKYWEETRGRVLAPSFRIAADERALELKMLLARSGGEFKKFGPTTLRLARVILHDLALHLAALSRASERQAHRLADLVSHKHRFERRESRNEFLKQVGEYKNGNTKNDLDTTA